MINHLLIYPLLSLAFLLLPPPSASGFTIELFHHHSPSSPLLNLSLSLPSSLSGDIRRAIPRSRSINRRLSGVPDSIRSPITPLTAVHLMKFSVGTPPVDVLAVMDTGSDLTWLRCQPCADCQGRSVPSINPSLSSSYKTLTCDSDQCKQLDPAACSRGPTCSYIYGYGDSSFTSGKLATETITFDTTGGGSPVSIPAITFGCGHNNSLSFDAEMFGLAGLGGMPYSFDTTGGGSPVSIPAITFGCGHNNSLSFDAEMFGLAGLGGMPYSLISQLGPQIKGRFSYCLSPFQKANARSFMNFGDEAVLAGRNVVTTPLVEKADKTFYFVTLEAVSVNGKKIDATASGQGNMFIDTGTTVNLIDDVVFRQLGELITEAVKLPSRMDPGNTFLCYKAGTRDVFPDITLHFAGGGEVVLKPMNAFSDPAEDGTVCLTSQATKGTAILGNKAQQNFHVGYDLVRKTVAFEPTECSKL
ncbi:putative aspartic protease [Apostasia shenzhenica]|uniref:Putative aspartic protease n=1 Tax=Apostasia shenzhenica TaxID=1088818 RepID=A0A2I0B398_9ASPA|nr:putative aspartic protease [Apostasia shenzhenica]